MSKKSKIAYEHYLDQFYKQWPNEINIEEFDYLTSPLRGSETVARNVLKRNIMAGKVGYVIRKHDPIRFSMGYNDWKR